MTVTFADGTHYAIPAEMMRVHSPSAEVQGHSPEQHAEASHAYAEQVLGSYRTVPVWIMGLVVPRNLFPES